MNRLNKIFLLSAALCGTALCLAGCKAKKKVVYLNPFEGREYFTKFSDDSKLSLVFKDDTHVDFITPDRGKIRDFTYFFNGEKSEVYFTSTGYYNAEGKSVSHKEFVESLTDKAKEILKSDSVRVDYPGITFHYDFDSDGDALNKLKMTQCFFDIDSATFSARKVFNDVVCYASVDFDYDSYLIFFNPEDENESDQHFFKSVERSTGSGEVGSDSRKKGTIRFECQDSETVTDSESGEQKFTKDSHFLNTKFTVIQKKGETKMKLTFVDGKYKGKSILLNFDPETIEFREGRWLNK